MDEIPIPDDKKYGANNRKTHRKYTVNKSYKYQEYAQAIKTTPKASMINYSLCLQVVTADGPCTVIVVSIHTEGRLPNQHNFFKYFLDQT